MYLILERYLFGKRVLFSLHKIARLWLEHGVHQEVLFWAQEFGFRPKNTFFAIGAWSSSMAHLKPSARRSISLDNIRENNAVWALFIAIFSAPHSYYEWTISFWWLHCQRLEDLSVLPTGILLRLGFQVLRFHSELSLSCGQCFLSLYCSHYHWMYLRKDFRPRWNLGSKSCNYLP